MRKRWLSTLDDFYPRSPRGERHLTYDLVTSAWEISIHAPREGSDPDPRAYKAKQQNFYPRSPRGERRATGDMYAIMGIFLSTLPARGATR